MVLMNRKVGLPRILSNANASGFSSKWNVLCFDGESNRAANVSPSRTSSESGSDNAPRYKRRYDAGITFARVEGVRVSWCSVTLDGRGEVGVGVVFDTVRRCVMLRERSVL